MLRALVLAVCLVPSLTAAQSRTFDDVQVGILESFTAVGEFEVAQSGDTLILTCTNCEQEVEIIISRLTNVAAQTEESPLDQYIEERRVRCFNLIAEREGRCVGTDPVNNRVGPGYTSLVEPTRGVEEREIVYQMGADLLIGRITYERRVAQVRTLERVMNDTLMRFSPNY